MIYLSYKHYGRNFLLITLINCVVTLLCIYMLAGCRIIFIMLNPKSIINTNSDDLKEFIPLQLTKMGYTKVINRISVLIPSSKTIENSQIDKSNSFANNPNSTFVPNTSTNSNVNNIR